MSQYPLTEKQKNLLRSIVPGLIDGSVESSWIIVTGDNRINGIFGLDRDGMLWRSLWKEVKPSDFDVFVRYGFFIPTGRGGYSLIEQLIMDAVKNNFQIGEETEGIHIGQIDISGNLSGNVSIGSVLNNAVQNVTSIPHANDSMKNRLSDLLNQLHDVTKNIPFEYHDSAEAVAEYANLLMQMLDKEKLNWSLIQITRDGLEKASETLTPMIPIVSQIVSQLLSTVDDIKR